MLLDADERQRFAAEKNKNNIPEGRCCSARRLDRVYWPYVGAAFIITRRLKKLGGKSLTALECHLWSSRNELTLHTDKKEKDEKGKKAKKEKKEEKEEKES